MHYFAYGSNMNLEHMRRLCGWHFHVLGLAYLPEYEFGPDTRGYSNVRPRPGQRVAGVLYEIDQYCLDALDEFEGYPEVFGRQEVEVENPAGKIHRAWIYVESADRFGGGLIREDYMRRVIAGARENHLPETWVRFLESFLKA